MAGADILGVFPIYYYADSEILLVGSSPELFRYHGLFRMELDLEGLVAILLMNNSFEGRTLLRGVRRLGPGRVLVWDRISAVRGAAVRAATRAIPFQREFLGARPVARRCGRGPCLAPGFGGPMCADAFGGPGFAVAGWLSQSHPAECNSTHAGAVVGHRGQVREASRQSSWVGASSDRDRRRSIRPLRDAPGDVGTHRYGLQHDSSVGRLRFRVLMSETSSQAS